MISRLAAMITTSRGSFVACPAPGGARAAPAVRVMVTRLRSILTPRTDLPFQNQPTGRSIMNTIHRIHHLISILAAGACALLAFAAAAPAAFAGTNPIPDPAGYVGDPYIGTSPVTPDSATTVHVVNSGGMAGWQIALIAIGAALLAATAAVVLDRAPAARRAAAATTA